MGYGLAADLLLVLHLLFIVFVLFGGWLCLHRIFWAWLHLPAMLWGIWIEWAGWICPLTPLEIHFRALANQQGYEGEFISHYLLPVLYPPGLTSGVQWFLGGTVIILNILIYIIVITKRRRRKTNN
jgi:hypothetical protein